MSAFHGLAYRARILWRALFDRDAYRRELNAELQHHLDLDAMHHGRAAARARFGNPTRVRERLVDGTGVSAVDALRQDVRFAWRTLRASPGFALVAVLTLAIGIGANTAIFSAVNALLVRPLPFPAPRELMQVGTTAPAVGDRPARVDGIWSYPKFVVFRDAQTVFKDLAVWTEWQSTLRGEGEAERVKGEVVGARYLTTLGVHPALGRNFLPEEDRAPNGPRVAIISDALWSRRFNADPHVLGRTLDVDNEPFTIVGVLPRGFRGLSGTADLLMPTMAVDPSMVTEAWNHSFSLVARVKPGVSYAQVERVVAALGKRVDAAYPDPGNLGGHWGADVRPLDRTRVDPAVRRALLVLSGAVGLVLLIACANVANLLLVRATGRRREIAVRLALGAGRGRLVRQLVTESVLLAAVGGVASLLLAWVATRALSSIDPANAMRAGRLGGLGAVSFTSIRLDLPALAFTAGLVLLTGVLFGLVPALQSTRPSLTGALKDDGMRAGYGARAHAGRSALAVSEIALALVLLAGSGLMLKSLAKLLAVSPGVDPSHLLAMRLGSRAGMARDSLPAFYDVVLERLAAVPGVTGVALQDCPPLNGGCNGTAMVRRDRPEPAPGEGPDVGVHWISPSWPTVMRTPLVRGRLFDRGDRRGARKVVLVSETAARTFWPNEDPLGKPVSVGQGGFWKDTAYVVGVVGDVRYETLDAPPRPDVYLSYLQSPSRAMLYVRTAGDPLAVAGAVRRAVADVAPDAPVYEVRTLASRFGDALAFARMSAVLLALFAAVALALATIGVYGVISFAAAERTREMGIRVALGATRRDVAGLVFRQGLAIALAGGAIGVLGALAATRVLRSLLYDVAPSDPATFVGVGALLLATIALASWTPARRAARVPPAQVLRDG
ncbi:permease [Gemmatirosa kalamazoonensis]|uniref:Permease n=1 Tax=Gemmatirosa kalamazoonensis TaxID=861299 RepID=W0RCG7_9BACT|nr:ABC transporter permease [Gemmatirosa kalamazoonensis]AHG88486.1 permease [Gemmatirosa kalamazoonensis]